MKHRFSEIEPKWQKKWEDAKLFNADNNSKKPKFYSLIEFPYPSGAGMHVGHIKAYSGLEVVSRKRRMQGYNVLFPIGFDAFGLPTENYAVKTNTHPRIVTDTNIEKFTSQLKKVGFSFDWSRVVDTTEENYYKWTQWIFLKMFEKGLVFRDTALVNYCPHCKVVLSNEDSQGGKCDICKSDVVQKSKAVWYLRITEYADKLLSGLDEVDYPLNIRQQQENWIGKSTGAFADFKIKYTDEKLRIYTTRCDTLFGVTFMVIAPENPIIDKLSHRVGNMDAIEAYRAECSKKTEFERTQLVKDKTGVKIDGIEAINPVTNETIPVYISDYVMMGYGTGAIMAVPAHDQRDYEFAKKFGIEIRQVIKGGDIEKEAYTGDGEMINSGFLNGFTNKKDSINRMLEHLAAEGIGEKGVQYKMKDWAFNRQRYWGEPIPLVHCPDCGIVAVPYEELPLKLPVMDKYEPGVGGESPLAKCDEFVNCTCPKCGGKAKRETDTMPQWAGSSWYFLRYCDPCNNDEFASAESLNYWLPVDWYNGGMEHVTRHLIYSRFWYKFLYDLGLVPVSEPYAKRSAQGLILGSDGEKMSKSKGNVVDPNNVVDAFGADVLRIYVLFMGNYGDAAPWSDEGVKGARRFLERFASLDENLVACMTPAVEKALHKTIKKVSEDIESMKYNTAIASMMSLVNEIGANGGIDKEGLKIFSKLLCPFAPHIAEEMWSICGGSGFCSEAKWPEFDPEKIKDDTIEIPVQVCGKLKAVVTVPAECDEDTVLEAAMKEEKVISSIEGKTVVKKIYVKNKLFNIVVK